jgi:hypothetical protein
MSGDPRVRTEPPKTVTVRKDDWESLRERLRLAQSDRDAERVLAAQHREEAQRLSAEVARLREERDLIAGALQGLVYCADCWDNPAHNVCEKHLAPARAALASLGSPQDERNTKKEDAK